MSSDLRLLAFLWACETQMAKVIDAQSKEIDELKKDNADKDKRIDALEQKMTEILAKLDSSKA